MKYLYDFGVSQDDPQVEDCGLNLEKSNLLCIASGGEVPLSLLANYDTRITSVDTSINQIRLCRLKLATVLELDSYESSVLLGLRKDFKNKRKEYISKVTQKLLPEDAEFWTQQNVLNGPVNLSRFERYISLFCILVRNVLGKKKIRRFLELDSSEGQAQYFDRHLNKLVIQWIFKIAFSSRLYKNKGLDQQALMHQTGNELPAIFYSKFRDFFTATPARLNFYLQFYMLGEVIFDEALPSYLQSSGIHKIRQRHHQLSFEVKSIFKLVAESDLLPYRNYALSNISDWCDEISMNDLLTQISKKAIAPIEIVMRFIHKNPINNATRNIGYEIDPCFEKMTKPIDRFPFYSLVKVSANNTQNR